MWQQEKYGDIDRMRHKERMEEGEEEQSNDVQERCMVTIIINEGLTG